MTIYIGQGIEIDPPVPADNAFMAAVNAGRESGSQPLWIRPDEKGRGSEIVCAGPEGYGSGDIDDLVIEVNAIIQGLGSGFTYRHYLYVEEDYHGPAAPFRIHVRDGAAYREDSIVVFASDAEEPVLLIEDEAHKYFVEHNGAGAAGPTLCFEATVRVSAGTAELMEAFIDHTRAALRGVRAITDGDGPDDAAELVALAVNELAVDDHTDWLSTVTDQFGLTVSIWCALDDTAVVEEG